MLQSQEEMLSFSICRGITKVSKSASSMPKTIKK